MGIDDVRRARACEQEAHSSAIVERVNFDGLEKRRESSLTSSIAPHLPNHRIRRVKRGSSSVQRGNERSRRLLVPIDRDQESCVENHNL